MNSCPHCGSTALVEDQSTGEVVCQACGHVVSRAPSTGPPLPAEGSSWGGRRDAGGGERIKRLLRLDRRLEGPRGRRHLEAWGEMRRISEALNLPRIALETAYVFYSEAQERGLLRRGSLLGFSAASVYAACRALDIPRTLKEVAEASMVGLREVRRTYRVMASTLGLPVGPTSPTVFLAQLSQSNGLSYPPWRKASMWVRIPRGWPPLPSIWPAKRPANGAPRRNSPSRQGFPPSP